MEVSLHKQVRAGLGRGRLNSRRTIVTQDGRVYAASETGGAEVRVGTDPVVIYILVGGEL